MERISKMPEEPVTSRPLPPTVADASPQAQTVARRTGRRAYSEGEKDREMGSYAALPSGIAYEVSPCHE